jgi:hypothetical protein
MPQLQAEEVNSTLPSVEGTCPFSINEASLKRNSRRNLLYALLEETKFECILSTIF